MTNPFSQRFDILEYHGFIIPYSDSRAIDFPIIFCYTVSVKEHRKENRHHEENRICLRSLQSIGKAIAEALAGEGYHLALTCEKSRETLEKSAQALAKNFHVQVLTFCGDMGDPAFVFSMGKEVLASFSKIDVIVNNAGISHIGLLCDMTAEEWNRILSVNLSSCFYTAKAFVPAMISAKSGRMFSNISSMWGTAGASCEAAYSASKGGVNSLTRALAKELAPSGISVNAIACGAVDTDMNAFLSSEERTALEEEIPAGRFATPEEVADTVLTLLKSPTYLTGQIVGLDGGYL